MNKGFVIAAAAAVALVLGGSMASAKSKHRRVARAEPAQIACTVVGCIPAPRQCQIVMARTFDGMPTGFDQIVCPPGVWPLK